MLGPDSDPKSRVLRMVRLPFVLYSRLVLYITVPIFRIQELAADRLAAETVGSYTYGEALRIVHQNCQAFDAYVIDSLRPVLGRGYLPPVMEGTRAIWNLPAENTMNVQGSRTMYTHRSRNVSRRSQTCLPSKLKIICRHLRF